MTVEYRSQVAPNVVHRFEEEAGDEDNTTRPVHGLPDDVKLNLANTAARLETIVASLTAIAGFVDGLEALVTTLGGYTDTLETGLALIAQRQAAPATIYDGEIDVAVAGSAEALGSQAITEGAWVWAKATNTDEVYVGASTVDDTRGGPLNAGDPPIFVRADNLSKIFADAAVSGEGVRFLGW